MRCSLLFGGVFLFRVFCGFLGPAFGRTDFSRIFIFEPPDFFADFLAGFFLLILVGKVFRKILQENPRENPPNFIQQKSSNTFLQIGRGKDSVRGYIHVLFSQKFAFYQTSKQLEKYILVPVPAGGPFSIFFRPDSGPSPPVRMLLQRKDRQIHWYRPFFSPLHGLFRKGEGLVLVYVFFSLRKGGSGLSQSRFLGRGCDEALFSEKEGF